MNDNIIDDSQSSVKKDKLKENKKSKKSFSHPIANAAGKVVDKKGYVSTIDLFLELGWLTSHKLTDWKMGRIPYLERVITANLAKISRTMKELRSWAVHSNLKQSMTVYKHKSHFLRFSKSGNAHIENAYKTHYVLPKTNKNNDNDPDKDHFSEHTYNETVEEIVESWRNFLF